VDNAASNEARVEVEANAAHAGTVEYLPAQENLGPAGGIALGMKRLLEHAGDEDWVMLLDDDDPPQSVDALSSLERFAHAAVAEDPRTAGVGLAGARFDWGKGRAVRVPDGDLAGLVTVDYVGGNKLPTYRVGAIRAVGPFRGDLFFGFDDLEFGLRLTNAGFRLYVDGHRWRKRRARKGHLGRTDGPPLRLADVGWRRYYSLRNVVWILRSRGRPWTALRLAAVAGAGKPFLHLARSPRQALRHLGLNARAVRDGWRGRMGRTIEPDGGTEMAADRN
jgi:glycosyltransferase involved in cell wall biosynthesis